MAPPVLVVGSNVQDLSFRCPAFVGAVGCDAVAAEARAFHQNEGIAALSVTKPGTAPVRPRRAEIDTFLARRR